MRRFWDERARENAFFFVDDRLTYRHPDLESFWRGGEDALDRLLDTCGASLTREDEVVEVGCGAGRMTRSIAARAGTVQALDVSERDARRRPADEPAARKRDLAAR